MKVVMQVRSLKLFLQLGFLSGRACTKCGICSFSSAAEAEAEAQDIATASADSGVLIPGRADVAGTSNYMQRFVSQAGPGHFRRFRVGGDVGDLVVSSMGMGTWQGDEKDEVDAKYVAAITRGLGVGFNIIDTSPCYRDCRSETAVGKSLAMAIQQGVINRNEVIVCSKVGFVHEDFRNRCGYDVHVRSLITSGVLQEKDVLDHDYHCMTPPYIKHMVDVSRKDLGVETIDVYYLHNPDVYLTDIPLETLLQMIKRAFATFEELVSQGKITMYGIATWSAFRVSPKAMSYLPLENIVSLAREVGGENHHFKVIESAYNANFQELATFPVQTVRGKKMPVLHAAHRLGLSVVGACSLSMNFLARNLKPEIRNKSPELGLERTNAQCALQFARTTPGIMTSLVGMSSMAHVEENAAIIKFPANPRS